jgi:hypothetical protein
VTVCPWAAESPVELGQDLRREFDVDRSRGFSFTRSRVDDLGIVDHARLGQHPGERQLRWRATDVAGQLLERGLARQAALVERRVGHQRDRALAHPRQQVELRPRRDRQ